MPVFATLGPAGSNHEWVGGQYLRLHGLDGSRLQLYSDFDACFEAMLAGDVHYVLQVAAHPTVPDMVARYRGRAHIIDAFVAPSQPMAVLVRRDAEQPRRLGFMAATRGYVDVSRWAEHVIEPTTVDVGNGLLAGRYQAGITLTAFAERHPDVLRLAEPIGTVTDAWIVYGREPVADWAPVVWHDSPAGRRFRGQA